MAARGAEEKLTIQSKILEIFEGSFTYNDGKEIRIPINGLQIKVALTAAKDNVEPGDDTAMPGVKATKVAIAEGAEPVFEDVSKTIVEPSAEELKNVSTLLENLGL